MITDTLVPLVVVGVVSAVALVLVLRIGRGRATRGLARLPVVGRIPALARIGRPETPADEDTLRGELDRLPTRLSTARAGATAADTDVVAARPALPPALVADADPDLDPATDLVLAAAGERRGRPGDDGRVPHALPPAPLATAGWVVRGHTNQGLQRERNEDSHLATPELVAVADGIGGGPAGDLASKIVIETVRHLLSRAEDPPRALAGSVARAASALFGAAMVDADLRGMGTTLDVVLLGSGSWPIAHGMHVGDGAVWYVPDGGRAVALTTFDRDGDGRLLSAVSSTGREPQPAPWKRHVRPGDRLVVTSDGFHAHLQGELAIRLIDEFRDEPPLDAARALVSAALGAGGRDNVTVVVADYCDTASARESGAPSSTH